MADSVLSDIHTKLLDDSGLSALFLFSLSVKYWNNLMYIHKQSSGYSQTASKTKLSIIPSSRTSSLSFPCCPSHWFCYPTHPEEKLQGLAAVEAAAEGDEDSSVGGPDGCPGWAGPAKRVPCFHQAPGPNPAQYHQGSSRPSWPGVGGTEGRGGGEGRGGREGEAGESTSQPLQIQREERKR